MSIFVIVILITSTATRLPLATYLADCCPSFPSATNELFGLTHTHPDIIDISNAQSICFYV